MDFRKNEILFLQEQIVYCGGIVGCAGMIIWNISLWPAFFPLSIGMLGLFLANCFGKSEVVTINEVGIQCKNKNTILWDFPWTEIEELHIGRRLREPSVEIELKVDSVYRKDFDFHQCYFQLGRTAKKAIKQYYKWPLTQEK